MTHFHGTEVATALVNLREGKVRNVELNPDVLPDVEKQYAQHGGPSAILDFVRSWAKRQHPYPEHIRWNEDGMKFETMRESREWVSAVVCDELGNLYDGYRTADEKIACSLVYELARLNTSQEPIFHIFAHEEYDASAAQTYYRVWVRRIQA